MDKDNIYLGLKIKELRKERSLTLKALAEEIGVSSSLLSQIERGLANPSLETLRQLSKTLDVPMFSFFIDDGNDEYEDHGVEVVELKNRIRISGSNAKSDDYETSYELLSPDLKGVIQLCEMELGPFQYSANSFNRHSGEEVAVCTDGQIELHLENKIILLNTGDSARIQADTKHRWKNPNESTCRIIFAISPPTF